MTLIPKSCSIQKQNSVVIYIPRSKGGADEKITIHRRADYFSPEALGTPVPEACPKLDIYNATFYIWCKKYGGISSPELKHMWQLEEVNLRLKKLVADQSLDNATCRACWQKKN
ncbi:hypothetical protein R3D73_003602 [Serratia marcescens]|uniref:transposase n=1 Tax=Serratia nevei TaxID=2703794 RepID=UPI002938B1EE|nr:hypothetical protein [Serratia marcescens]ELQ9440311.1 hypothetical protein [Serratia marcescens]ELT5561858.1 hypothetical protein [Serratia marcescens]